jgi:hypothetical protein
MPFRHVAVASPGVAELGDNAEAQFVAPARHSGSFTKRLTRGIYGVFRVLSGRQSLQSMSAEHEYIPRFSLDERAPNFRNELPSPPATSMLGPRQGQGSADRSVGGRGGMPTCPVGGHTERLQAAGGLYDKVLSAVSHSGGAAAPTTPARKTSGLLSALLQPVHEAAPGEPGRYPRGSAAAALPLPAVPQPLPAGAFPALGPLTPSMTRSGTPSTELEDPGRECGPDSSTSQPVRPAPPAVASSQLDSQELESARTAPSPLATPVAVEVPWLVPTAAPGASPVLLAVSRFAPKGMARARWSLGDYRITGHLFKSATSSVRACVYVRCTYDTHGCTRFCACKGRTAAESNRRARKPAQLLCGRPVTRRTPCSPPTALRCTRACACARAWRWRSRCTICTASPPTRCTCCGAEGRAGVGQGRRAAVCRPAGGPLRRAPRAVRGSATPTPSVPRRRPALSRPSSLSRNTLPPLGLARSREVELQSGLSHPNVVGLSGASLVGAHDWGGRWGVLLHSEGAHLPSQGERAWAGFAW